MKASKDFPKHRTEERSLRWRTMVCCYWCGWDFRTATRDPMRKRTREHLVPKSLGGPATNENLVAACYNCNLRRGNDTSWVPYAEKPHFREAFRKHTRGPRRKES